jgi:hypothetical protein
VVSVTLKPEAKKGGLIGSTKRNGIDPSRRHPSADKDERRQRRGFHDPSMASRRMMSELPRFKEKL